MTKIIRTSKSKGIKAVSQKDNKLRQYKILSKFIVSGGNDRLLTELLKMNEHDLFNFKFRSISQLLMYPKIISYINKYMNHKFTFMEIQSKDWFTTIMMICKLYGITNTNQLYYGKFQQIERDLFINLIKEYNTLLGNTITINNSELNALFTLYKFGVIKEEYINKIKDAIDGKDSKSKPNQKTTTENQFNLHSELVKTTISNPDEVIQSKTVSDLSLEIQAFINTVNNYIKNRNVCRNCELNAKESIIIDTNMKSPGPVDIMFVGFNPSRIDLKNGIPLSSGPESMIFHKLLQPLIDKHKLTYVITNFVLCTNPGIDIQLKNKRKVISNCSQIFTEINSHFTPKFKVVLGADAATIVGAKGGIAKVNGTMVNDIFIMLDPTTAIVNQQKAKIFYENWLKLEELIIAFKQNELKIVKTETINIDESRIITKLTNDLTLFDIKQFGDKIVYIMVDVHGTKKYLINSIQYPVYIKNGTYPECISFTNKVDGVVYCTDEQRKFLNSQLYRDINKCNKV